MDIDPNGFLDGLRRGMATTPVERAGCARLPLALRVDGVRRLRPAVDLCCAARVDDADRRDLAPLAGPTRGRPAPLH